MKIYHLFIIMMLTGSMGCSGVKHYFIGITKKETKVDESGNLIRYEKVNIRTTRIIYDRRRRVNLIERTRIKIYSNNKIIKKTYRKTKIDRRSLWAFETVLKSRSLG